MRYPSAQRRVSQKAKASGDRQQVDHYEETSPQDQGLREGRSEAVLRVVDGQQVEDRSEAVLRVVDGQQVEEYVDDEKVVQPNDKRAVRAAVEPPRAGARRSGRARR